MRTLTLMRHAKSSWSEPDRADHDRPLNKRGKNAVELMAKRLKAAGYRPDLIVSSSALRAKETASRFSKQYDGQILHREESILYEASADTYEKVIRKTDRDIRDLMIIAHNPEIEIVVTKLAGHYHSMPTAAYARFEIPDAWQNFTLHAFKLADYDYPKSSR